MKAIIYNRHSQDSGTGVSEEIQDPRMLALVEARGGEVVAHLPSDDASSFTLDRPSFNEARRMLNAGEADTLVIPELRRLTRRRWHWEELLNEMDVNGWTVVPLDFPSLDLSTPMGRKFAGDAIDYGEVDYRQKREAMNDARCNAVMLHGAHGGSVAPLGLDWTTRGHAGNGKPLKGPLALVGDPDDPATPAGRVLAGFKAFDEGASWAEVVKTLGVKSVGNARAILTNRVYLGEARSGDYVKANAHEAIVDEALFNRVADKLALRSAKGERKHGKASARILGRVLTCPSGHTLRYDGTSASYRCKAVGCTTKVSVNAPAAEAYLIEAARDHHRASHEAVAMALTVDAALVPELERAVIEAEANRLEVEALEDEVTPAHFAKAMTKADAALDVARRALDNAEAGKGWHGMTPERVEAKLAEGDPATVNGFVKAMVKATVKASGRSRHVAVADRLTVTTLVAGKLATERHPEAPLRDLARVSG